MNEGRFTFREYALRYMRYEWNDSLEKSLLQPLRQPRRGAGALTAGLSRSTESAEGHVALARALIHAGDDVQAVTALRRRG